MKNKINLINQVIKGKNEEIIDLKKFFPLGNISGDYIEKIFYKAHLDWIELSDKSNFNDVTARYIKIITSKDSLVKVDMGLGYIAKENNEWNKAFIDNKLWAGGDGIFSFNIKNGNDSYNQTDAKTLFVFGDTLISKNDQKTQNRIEPVLMPNNTVGYLDGNGMIHKNIEFKINTDYFDTIKSFFAPNNTSIYDGTTPYNLVKYNPSININPYLSGYNPKKVELVFNLNCKYDVSHLNIYNYFSEKSQKFETNNRGFKNIVISVSNDGLEYENIIVASLEKATSNEDFTKIDIEQEFQCIKISVNPVNGDGNHYDQGEEEVIFGINKVEIFSNEKRLEDISVCSTSVLSLVKSDSWFWLQDGVVIDNYLYFLPLLIVGDLDKPEGLQFAVRGVSMIKVPIMNEEVVFEKQVQKDTPFSKTIDGTNWLFGNAIMSRTIKAGSLNPDGYIYVYGFTTFLYNRELKVARVKPESFELFDTWEYYADGKWVKEMTKASTILSHISCEMSVSEIVTGENKGKFIAVFTYDVDSEYVAYSIGDNPWGPFTEPNVVYECPEPKLLKRDTYTYNAKAHPHLSKEDELLVSYNTNTYSMEHNNDNYKVYRPRFINLLDTSKIMKK